jgi:hypothetical protein
MGAPFPANWLVFPTAEFETFNNNNMADAGRGIQILLKLDRRHKATTDFKICLFGGDDIRARISLTALFSSLPPMFHGLHIELSCPNEFATPPPDSTVTPWVDLETLIKTGVVTLADTNKDQVAEGPFMEFLQHTVRGAPLCPASLRWAVAVSPEGDMQLELQFLPLKAKKLNRGAPWGENSVSILLGAIPLLAEKFEGPEVLGPVPLFFSDQREAAFESLDRNPETVAEDLRNFNLRFLHMEHLSLEEMDAHLEKKSRPARGTPAFPRTVPATNKKARTDPSQRSRKTGTA